MKIYIKVRILNLQKEILIIFKVLMIHSNNRNYNNKKSTDLLNTSFSELIKSNPNYTIPKFFEVYKDYFLEFLKVLF